MRKGKLARIIHQGIVQKKAVIISYLAIIQSRYVKRVKRSDSLNDWYVMGIAKRSFVTNGLNKISDWINVSNIFNDHST